MRHGYTLLELVLILVIAGICFAITLPRFGGLMDGLAVSQAAREVASAHSRARIAAILAGRPIVLTISPDSLAYRVAGQTASRWRGPGPARGGVVMGSPARQITFSPVGITMGLANASYRFTRGASSRTVVVSRLGRVRVTTP